MALQSNTARRYLVAQPDFDSVQLSEHWTPPGVSTRRTRGMRAANGADISQLGADRLVLNYKSQLVRPRLSRAYFQPTEFELDEPRVVAARVTANLGRAARWSEDATEAVQRELAPKGELTDDEVEQIVEAVKLEVDVELPALTQIIAGFVNNSAAGNNAIKDLILAAKADVDVSDTRTIAAGATNEQVAAIDADDVKELSIEHLTTIASQVPSTDKNLLKAVNTLLGLAYRDISPKLAAAFEPFSTEVEKARVTRILEIDDEVVNRAINYEGIIDDLYEMGNIDDNVVIEVVYAHRLSPEHLNHLTDTEFDEDEVYAIANPTAEGVSEAVVNSAAAKLRNARAAPGVDWIEYANEGDDDAATEDLYEAIGAWEQLKLPQADLEYLVAVGKYAIAAPTTRVINTSSASSEALCDFATARMNIINHVLHGDSDEVIFYDEHLWGALSLPKSLELFDAVTDDIVGQVQHATAHISYMKSGHHATANNLGHTLTKLLEAIDYAYEASDIPSRLAFGTYYGTKPADQRAVAIFLRAKYARNELSFAIGRRITPHGPGTVSMFLLNIVMQQLDNVKFFDFLGRKDSYNQFKGLYTSYAKTSYLEVPYARYFYGESKAESTSLKQAVGPMYAYAAAIGAAMPQSTIGDSVALRREASAAAANSITARLEVESFVKAYRTFLRTTIRDKMSKQAGISGAAALIEDAEG